MALDLRPDIILMDVVMPGEMNGIDAAEKIKSECNIPIIFISGYGEPEHIEKAKMIGPFGYVMKPFDEKEVRAFIEIALHKKKMEEALRKSEDRYRALVEGTDDIILRTNSVGVVTYVNRSVEKNFGINPKQLIGLSALGFVHSEDQELAKKILETSIRNREPSISLENHIFNPVSQELFRIKWTINTHYDENSCLTGLTCIGKDFTDQKKLEKAVLDAIKLKSVAILAGGIAHDFSNIIASIVCNIGLAKMDLNVGSMPYTALLKAENESVHIKELISRLLTLSKKEEPLKELVSLADLLNIEVNSFKKRSDMDCMVSLPDNILPVEVDSEQMKHVIHNIMANAQRAMSNKGTISISCENVEVLKKNIPRLEDGKFVKFSIRDQGTGMSQLILSKAFDPYFTTKKIGNQKGLGLGLAECDSIVKNHGGIISMKSQLVLGTTVSVYLPAMNPDHKALAAPVKSTRLSTKADGIRSPSGIQKVLLIETTEMFRNAARLIVNRFGYEVKVASDGTEGIEAYRREMETENPFDIVILNLNHKNDAGGIETLDRLLEIHSAVRAILTSSQPHYPAMRDFRGHGFCAVLEKPFTFDEMKVAFREAASG
jgi:two-component system, cell cycle sensor histidine kinase and response regulator CckA